MLGFDENPQAHVELSHSEFRFVPGPLPEKFGAEIAAVVVSPGVPLGKPALSAATAAGIPLWGEIELGALALPAGAGPLLGITGTNGKSTTTALLGTLMAAHVPRAFVGGNLGTPLTSAYERPTTPPYDVHVVELSSFQLESLRSARFSIAAILNVTPDHLDRYANVEAYGQAKARIFATQRADDAAVINADDATVRALASQARGQVYGFTRQGQQALKGLAGGAVGLGQEFHMTLGGGYTFSVRNRALRGAHNLENAMAASLMASLAGVSPDVIQRGLDAFPGLRHRLELVRQRNGVEWLNDSKATNVDSAVMAMRAMTGPVWLIAGGKGKGAPYTPLVAEARGKVKGVLTIGSDAGPIGEAFSEVCAVHACQTLEAAVALAAEISVAGETVLLSPACASYDQFKHFEHRGDVFQSLVRALP